MVSHLAIVMLALGAESGAAPVPLPGTASLTLEGLPGALMVEGIDRYLDRALADSVQRRAEHWNRDFSSRQAYEASIRPNRDRLARILGVVDPRTPGPMESVAPATGPAVLAEAPGYTVRAVRWKALAGVDGEGLLLEPKGAPTAAVIALGDCDQPPERLAGLDGRNTFAQRLAESGCRVLIPVLIDRRDTWSGHPDVRMTNQPHREFVYRAAYEMGRHIIGYEVQKALAAVDIFHADAPGLPVAVAGYGEGGLLALYAAALDTRIAAVAVSGYFQPRERVWAEPIYRNVWALLHEFGDAEVASLVAPRPLVVEWCPGPDVSGPPAPRDGRSGAAPGAIETPDPEAVAAEVARARALTAGLEPPAPIHFFRSDDGPLNDAALAAFLGSIGSELAPQRADSPPTVAGTAPDADARMRRQFDQLVEHTQQVMRESPLERARFWSKADAADADTWTRTAQWYRDYFAEEVIGSLPALEGSANPRAKQVFDEPRYVGYEVALDVLPDVFAYGLLLVPKDIAAGERRPVVVCQHGLEGTPGKAAHPGVNEAAYGQYGCRLAERGFVVYAPQNPYIGGDAFRVLQRKANPLKLSLFSFIVRQHERTLEWLAGLPFVDPGRIGLYGISYGGKTAMRVPAILPQYALSICSADFNEWIWKNVSARDRYSYLFTGEYEMPEFNLGNTFNYAEMSWLIFPRPFMVERGHHDGVAPDEWVAYEYARTFRHYNLLGLGDRTEIEYFDGPHAIHGEGTFDFLHKHLHWDAPADR